MVSFRTLAVSAVAAFSIPAFATLSPQQLKMAIDSLTMKSNSLIQPAQSLNLINGPLVVVGQGPLPQIVLGFGDIVTTATGAFAMMQGMPPIPEGSDSDAVFDSFRDFVRIHQNLLKTLIGKAGLFTTVPFVGTPVSAVLRSIEKVVDTLTFNLIDTLQGKQAECRQQGDMLDQTVEQAISSFSGLGGGSNNNNNMMSSSPNMPAPQPMMSSMMSNMMTQASDMPMMQSMLSSMMTDMASAPSTPAMTTSSGSSPMNTGSPSAGTITTAVTEGGKPETFTITVSGAAAAETVTTTVTQDDTTQVLTITPSGSSPSSASSSGMSPNMMASENSPQSPSTETLTIPAGDSTTTITLTVPGSNPTGASASMMSSGSSPSMTSSSSSMMPSGPSSSMGSSSSSASPSGASSSSPSPNMPSGASPSSSSPSMVAPTTPDCGPMAGRPMLPLGAMPMDGSAFFIEATGKDIVCSCSNRPSSRVKRAVAAY